MTANKEALAELKTRANLRKSNPNLHHTPNKNDLRIASEHANLMVYHQYQAINADKGESQ